MAAGRVIAELKSVDFDLFIRKNLPGGEGATISIK
jgi:hypothetical protein